MESTQHETESRGALFARVRSLGLLTLLSRVLGLIRDGVMAMQFGNGVLMDAFTVAFRVPNLTRQLFGEGALSTAFLPVFIRERAHAGEDVAFRTATAVLIYVSLFLFGLVVVVELVLLAIWLLVPVSAEAELLIGLTAVLLPYLMLVCVLAQACAVMHGLGQFSIPALFPVLLNTIWIAVAFLVWATIDDATVRVSVIAAAIVGIGLLQLTVSLPTLRQLGFRFQPDWSQSRDRVREISRTMLPVVAGLSITQLNTLLDSLIAWGLTAPADGSAGWLGSFPLNEGTAAALYLGQRMYQFPLGVFGAALGTVLFPLLATHASREQFDLFSADLSRGLSTVIAIGIPASVGLVLIARPLTVTLFQRGSFDATDTEQTTAVIMMYALAVWASCGMLIVHRAFYALGDRRTPLRAGLASVLVNLVLSLALVWPLGGRGLALATATGAMIQCMAVTWLLSRKLEAFQWKQLTRPLFKTMFATGLMALGCLAVQYLLQEVDVHSAIELFSILSVGVFVFLMTAVVTGLKEPFDLLQRRSDTTD